MFPTLKPAVTNMENFDFISPFIDQQFERRSEVLNNNLSNFNENGEEYFLNSFKINEKDQNNSQNPSDQSTLIYSINQSKNDLIDKSLLTNNIGSNFFRYGLNDDQNLIDSTSRIGLPSINNLLLNNNRVQNSDEVLNGQIENSINHYPINSNYNHSQLINPLFQSTNFQNNLNLFNQKNQPINLINKKVSKTLVNHSIKYESKLYQTTSLTQLNDFHQQNSQVEDKQFTSLSCPNVFFKGQYDPNCLMNGPQNYQINLNKDEQSNDNQNLNDVNCQIKELNSSGVFIGNNLNSFKDYSKNNFTNCSKNELNKISSNLSNPNLNQTEYNLMNSGNTINSTFIESNQFISNVILDQSKPEHQIIDYDSLKVFERDQKSISNKRSIDELDVKLDVKRRSSGNNTKLTLNDVKSDNFKRFKLSDCNLNNNLDKNLINYYTNHYQQDTQLNKNKITSNSLNIQIVNKFQNESIKFRTNLSRRKKFKNKNPYDADQKRILANKQERARMKKQNEALDGLRNVIQERLNCFKIVNPNASLNMENVNGDIIISTIEMLSQNSLKLDQSDTLDQNVSMSYESSLSINLKCSSSNKASKLSRKSTLKSATQYIGQLEKVLSN